MLKTKHKRRTVRGRVATTATSGRSRPATDLNLTAEERQMLEQVLYELRLRFVEASGSGKRIIEP